MMFASSTVQFSIRLDIVVLKPFSIVCVIKLVVCKAMRPSSRKRADQKSLWLRQTVSDTGFLDSLFGNRLSFLNMGYMVFSI